MSTAINNAGNPLEHHSTPKRINVGIINIPLNCLKELYPDIQRFTAIAVVFSYHPDSLSKPGGGTPDKYHPFRGPRKRGGDANLAFKIW
ncbi:hypothetical protein N7517_009304 [Penicillium concentricum]|uniref:Uncharacterized protein n=1 Tax=Penicillium concentricum TaxID=293559 RepID=A0A9W9UWH3_9EURO|nr:uncharacterized protein N7517_009304 [Penicillium concentricum]KAJ5360113.1 hypothetical protein N7517_009304 [Penicillium concentricum]